MNIIGIMGAMEEEIVSMKEKINVIEEQKIAGSLFYIGSYNNHKIILVKSGIGKVNGAISAQAMIDHFKITHLFFTGVAGALDSRLKVGDIVISTDTAQHDMDTTAFGDPIGVIPRMEESFFKADEALLQIAKDITKNITEYQILFGRIASGDQFISTKEGKEKIQRTVSGICAEMEGAGVAQACFLNDVPFLIIRAISDGADDDAFDSYEKFCSIAAERSSELMERFLNIL